MGVEQDVRFETKVSAAGFQMENADPPLSRKRFEQRCESFEESRSPARIPVVQTADVGDRDDLSAHLRGLDSARLGRLHKLHYNLHSLRAEFRNRACREDRVRASAS